MELTGASALVTGGASGLGLATVKRLLEGGAKVTIVDLPSSPGADVAAEVGARFAPADVTDPDQVVAAVQSAAADGPLRVVVNCAGIAPPAKVLDREGAPNPLAAFEKIIRINLIGTYNVIGQAAAVMARTEPTGGGDRGVIVNTASVAAFDGQIGQPAYSASKGGVHAMTLPIARELARYGIRVLTIAPGIMETPMLMGLPQEAQDSLGQQVPYPARLGRPDEYARLVLSIVDNDYLNGETIRLDGAIEWHPGEEVQEHMSEPILFTVDDGLARITLNRPTRLNAFDEETARSWERITADAVARDDVGAILLDAEGPSFCAGGDVLSMAAGGFSADGIAELAGVINRGILSLTQSAKPVVAAAQGTTAGGGLGILLASDYAVVGTNSRVGSLYANMGLTPDLSVTAQLGRAVGQRRALQLVLQDRLLTADEAIQWGLVAESVEPDQVRARGEAVARFWLDGAAAAYGQAKRLVRAAVEESMVDQLGDEARTIGAALASPEAQARVAAFAAASARKAAS